jgi:hypothetical protein
VTAGAGSRSLNPARSAVTVAAELRASAWIPAKAVTARAVPSMAALSLPGLGIRVVTTLLQTERAGDRLHERNSGLLVGGTAPL